jgi:hypothetical protein
VRGEELLIVSPTLAVGGLSPRARGRAAAGGRECRPVAVYPRVRGEEALRPAGLRAGCLVCVRYAARGWQGWARGAIVKVPAGGGFISWAYTVC